MYSRRTNIRTFRVKIWIEIKKKHLLGDLTICKVPRNASLTIETELGHFDSISAEKFRMYRLVDNQKGAFVFVRFVLFIPVAQIWHNNYILELLHFK